MKTYRFISIAALALVGIVMTGCSSSDDNISDEPQPQSDNQSKVVTLTTTVGLSGTTTRALAADGTKTFVEGDKMVVVYKNASNETVKAESVALNAEDISDDGKSATFTVTLDDPDKTQDVTYVYPAAMVNNDGSINYDALATQNGRLATLASTLDYCTKSGAWVADALPMLTLENQLTILAYTLKNRNGSSDITSSIIGMTISDGTHNYTINRAATEDPIYVAIRPVINADIEITATDGSTNYVKSLKGKTYAANNGYNISLKMQPTYPIALSNVTSAYIGSVITTDGNVYATACDAAAVGENAVAQIISLGYALALEDEGMMNWETAISVCQAKNNSSKAVAGATWQLPSVDDWVNMGADDQTMTRDALLYGFEEVCGINMNCDGYWSSTKNGPSDSEYAWLFDFLQNIWCSNYKKNINYVRACLTF